MDRVTVIEAGRMGSALATALHKRGFETTVWNRTPSKMEFLSRLGLRVAMQLVKTLMPAVDAALTDLYGKAQSKDYGNTQATLATWTIAPRELVGWCANHRVTDTFAAPLLSLMQRAVHAGQGQKDFAYLYEVLKQGAD